MSYTTADGRRQVLDAVAAAADQIGIAGLQRLEAGEAQTHAGLPVALPDAVVDDLEHECPVGMVPLEILHVLGHMRLCPFCRPCVAQDEQVHHGGVLTSGDNGTGQADPLPSYSPRPGRGEMRRVAGKLGRCPLPP